MPPSPSERPNTYIIQDRAQNKELERVNLQDQLFTASMGGPLSEQPDPSPFQSILDVGCGTGRWLIDVAKASPQSTRLVGVDASGQVIASARAQAEAAHVADRVTFQVMDALRMLEFPNNTFDLVNQRLGMSYLRTWDWNNLLTEYQRVTRTGGVVRITECGLPTSTSPSFNRLCDLLLEAFFRAGHFFSPERESIIQALPALFQRQGYRNIQKQAHLLRYQGGTREGVLYRKDILHTYRLIVPFLQKWIRLPDDYEAVYQHMLEDMQKPECTTALTLLTVWGTNLPERR